jgi:RES domain/HEPN/RES N-terminal domain 1
VACHWAADGTDWRTGKIVSTDLTKIKKKRICAACTNDKYLRQEIGTRGKKGKCSYCQSEGKTIRIEEFADYIESAFEDHYELTSWDSYPYDERQGEQVSHMIQEAAEIDEPPAEDVRAILEDRNDLGHDKDSMYEENPFSSEAQYQSKGVHIGEYLAEWEHFRETILTETRLFNSQAESILGRIFEGLEEHTTAHGKNVIVNAGPAHSIKALFRARAFQSDAQLEAAIARPDSELGPPPHARAVAGRMNSRGIGVFYGATHAGVALAEIRPPVGSRVLVGRFEIIRPLRLLDLEAMRSIRAKGSIFESSYVHALEKTAFLDTMSARITRPVMPDDEASEYLVTQAIADYLATRTAPALDGIMYPSAQQSGKAQRNVVLFHKSALVQSIPLPKHTEISAHVSEHDEDGVRPDYSVFVSKPPAKDKTKPTQQLFAGDPFADVKYGGRDPSLRIDVSSLKVYHIESVKFSVRDFPVRRHETEMSAKEVEGLEAKEEKFDF